MPVFKVSAELLKAVAGQLQGYPVLSGPDGKLLDPGVMQVLSEYDGGDHPWQPGTKATTTLVLVDEACKELVDVLGGFGIGGADRRVLKRMTVPLCNMMDQLDSLFRLLNTPPGRAERSAWDIEDQSSFISGARELRKKHLQGAVRTVRNKLGAHLDADALGAVRAKLRLEELLPAMGTSIVLLADMLKHQEPFAWIRPVPDPRGPAVETWYSYPLCSRWLTDSEGTAIALIGLFTAADPKDHVRATIAEAAAIYNGLIKQSESSQLALLEVHTHRERISDTPVVSVVEPGEK